MHEPPRADRRRENQQPVCLVAPVDAPLLRAGGLLGLLLGIRLDAPLDHRGALAISRVFRLSIGERCRSLLDFPFD